MLLSEKLDNNVKRYCKEIVDDVKARFPNKTKIDYRSYPSMASACCYSNTKVYHDCSKTPRNVNFDNRILNAFHKMGGAPGKIVPGCKNLLGACAEQRAANNLLIDTFNITQTYSIKRILFSNAYRPRTLEKHPMCKNCSRIFK